MFYCCNSHTAYFLCTFHVYQSLNTVRILQHILILQILQHILILQCDITSFLDITSSHCLLSLYRFLCNSYTRLGMLQFGVRFYFSATSVMISFWCLINRLLNKHHATIELVHTTYIHSITYSI